MVVGAELEVALGWRSADLALGGPPIQAGRLHNPVRSRRLCLALGHAVGRALGVALTSPCPPDALGDALGVLMSP